MFKKIILMAVLAVSINSFSHEGHDNAPGTLKSNHGGVVKSGQEFNLEYVVSGSEVKLYPVSHEGKDLPLNEVTLKVTTKLSKGKAEILKADVVEGVYTAKVDFKNAYRLEMNVEASHKNKKGSFKFQVEK